MTKPRRASIVRREFTDEERRRGRHVISQTRQAAAMARALHIAKAVVFERKGDREIAEELGISREALWNWKCRHRDLLDETFEAAIAQVKEIQAAAALTLRAGMSEKVDKALDVFDEVLAGTPDKPAKDTARLKAASKVIDYVDPPQKGSSTVNVNVFSEKATALLRSVASQDLTPRKPLPRPREIDVDAERPGTEDDEGT
jgi:hypothetical protein